MKSLIHEIESLNHLMAFEAAARHSSFTRAAEELGISQPAVSQSVRRLEAAIGIRLFNRNHRVIALTDAGEMLQQDVSRGFSRIHETIKQLRRQATGNHITLSVSSAFANYWMVPRLQDFRQKYPDIDLRMQQTDKDLDLAQEGISLAIWRGNGKWRGYESALIAKERITALASPQWIAQNPPIETLEELAQSQLITLEEPHRNRPDWRNFFAHFNVPYHDSDGGLRLNDYALVIQAALAGQGIIFGWEHIARLLIEAGLLQNIGPWRWETDNGFHVVWSKNDTLSQDATNFRDWLILQAE